MTNLFHELFFAPRCVLCGAPSEASDKPFCHKCGAETEKLYRVPCRICGKRQSDCRCVPTLLSGKGADAVHLIAYEGELSKKLIFLLKQRDLRSLQGYFAKALSEAICHRLSAEELSECELAFAPRSAKGKGLYGFDQAKRLCRLVARRLSLPMKELFAHTRYSAEQKTKRGTERPENAEKSFRLAKHQHREKSGLILLDDVITTGSTMAKLISLAREAGYERILIAAVMKTVYRKN